jgi:hypothetical protein
MSRFSVFDIKVARVAKLKDLHEAAEWGGAYFDK